MRTIRKHGGIALFAGAFAFGCVLVVDPPQNFAATCPFAGADAACGRCIAGACQSYVDRCCGDGLCRTTMARLDSCAVAGGGACESIAFPTNASPASDALAACVVHACAKPCAVSADGPPAGSPSKTSCTALSDETSCRCSVPTGGSAPNAVACSSAVVTNALCCADLDWPLAGTECRCHKVACETTNGGAGCECSASGSGPLTSCSTGGGCCQDSVGFCECGSSTSLCTLAGTPLKGYTSVASCGASTVGCGSSKKLVSSCSAR